MTTLFFMRDGKCQKVEISPETADKLSRWVLAHDRSRAELANKVCDANNGQISEELIVQFLD